MAADEGDDNEDEEVCCASSWRVCSRGGRVKVKRETWWRAAGVTVVVSLACAMAAAGIATASRAPVTIDTNEPTAPAISGDRVVWSDYVSGSYDVFLYDGATGVTSRLTSTPENEVQPAIDGDHVVWARYDADDADIIAYDIPSGTYGVVTGAIGNQISPDVCGDYVVWEERGTSYVPQVYARRLDGGVAFKVDGASQSAARRPVMGGDWVVYEYLPLNLSDDVDVRAYNLVTAQKIDIANTDAQEALPATDGRYVAWSQTSTGDRDIKGYDLQLSTAFDIRTQPGEQTFPVVDSGKAYWVDNQSGKRLHVDGYDFATAETFTFNDGGSSDVNGVSARDGGISWLEPRADGQWRLRALLGPSSSAMNSLAQFLPVSPAWLPFRLAQLSTGGDSEGPDLVSTSVDPGETNVDKQTSVTAYFSEPLDAGTVTEDAVRLVSAATGDAVPASVRYSSLAKAVTVTPSSPLPEDTLTLEIASSVADRAGNTLPVPIELSFSTDSILADILAPTKPGDPFARVEGLSQVELTWTASTDNVGVVAYDIYRDSVTFTSIGSRTPIATLAGTATSAMVNIDSTVPTERSKKYTLYYVIVARDAVGNIKLSNNAIPDPHGTTSVNTNTCLSCHSVHGSANPSWGALGAKGAEACYLCHGSTAMATAYGHASSLNTQARFFDYAADPLPTGGTRHRNTWMTVDKSNQDSCDMCHTSHRKPYDADSTKGYTRMLRYWDGSKFVYYRSDGSVVDVNGAIVQTGLGNEYCTSCHGSELGGAFTRIESDDVGGAGAYASSAGDHLTGFEAGAHGSTTVKENPARPAADGPRVSCEACHNKHASPSAGLIDYRVSNTTAQTYNQAGVCFACHVDNYAAEQASGMSVAGYTFSTWWPSAQARNLRTQFAKTSAHPYQATIPGEPASGDGELTCYNCHNTHVVQKGGTTAWNMTRVSYPNNTKKLMSVYSTNPSDFCLVCHDGTAPVAVTNQKDTLVPYTAVFTVLSAEPFFPGWNKSTGWSTSGHGSSTGMSVGCDNCHDPHASDNQRLTAFTRQPNRSLPSIPGVLHTDILRNNTTTYAEEDLCYGCHPAIATPNCDGICHGFNMADVQTPMNQTYAHPTDDFTGRHEDTEVQADFGASNRHAECADCHDPHVERAGRHTAQSAAAGNVLRGVTGVKPSYGAGEWAVATAYTATRFTGITSGASTDYEAYLCFKCHSSYSGQPYDVTSNGRTYTSTDVALEFNPANESGHNVVGTAAAGTAIWPKTSGVGAANDRTWSLPSAATWLKTANGWSATSMVACSDCHTWSGTGAKGPHGSSVVYMIDSAYTTTYETATLGGLNGALICSKCHNADYPSMNNVHDHWRHSSSRCIGCHVTIPHGWKRPRLLGYRGDPAPYTSLYVNGLTDKSYTPTSWTLSACGVSCTGKHSSTQSGTRWP